MLDLFKKNQRLILILTAVLVLLLIPFVSMQFTDEVNWDLTDFLIMGVLLLGTGLLCEGALRRVKKNSTRLLICGIILILFFVVWAELAVGIFGTPFAGS